MYAKFAARVPGIGQCRVIYRADAVNQFGAAQGNTAGGPLANGRSLALPEQAGHQIGIGLAKADAGIAQGDFLII